MKRASPIPEAQYEYNTIVLERGHTNGLSSASLLAWPSLSLPGEIHPNIQGQEGMHKKVKLTQHHPHHQVGRPLPIRRLPLL